MHNQIKTKIPKKIKNIQGDIAPFGFIFDVMRSENFAFPVLPVPLRIDKVILGNPTFIIPFNFQVIENLTGNLNYKVIFNKIYNFGLKNLIDYSKSIANKMSFRGLNEQKVKDWFIKSKSQHYQLLSLSQDFTNIFVKFFSMYYEIIENKIEYGTLEYQNKLIQYCNESINYFKDRLEENRVLIKIGGNIEEYKIYLEKRGRFYPQTITIQSKKSKRNQIPKFKHKYVPYLIFDDLIENFIFTKKTIENDPKKAIQLTNSIYMEIFQEIKNNTTKNTEFIIDKINLTDVLKNGDLQYEKQKE